MLPLIFYLVAQLLDILTTLWDVSHGYVEGNIWVSHNVLVLMLDKSIAILVLSAIWMLGPRIRKIGTPFIYMAAGATFAAAAGNLMLYFHLT
jgi:hypothetical protein